MALLQGLGAIETDLTLRPGTFRLRLKGAQRQRNSVPGNFDQQVVRVSIGGTQVALFSFEDSNYGEYITRPYTVTTTSNLTILIEGTVSTADYTAFVDEIQFERISEWDHPGSWTAGIPDAASNVLIPAGVEVALVGNTNVSNSVFVAGELLGSNQDATLDTGRIAVKGPQSLFEVGRDDTPYLENFTLTLTAKDEVVSHENSGNKFVLAEEGGTIRLSGDPKVNWTKLAVPANPGAKDIFLVDAVNWKPGDEIVIAGSTHQRRISGVDVYEDFAEKKQVGLVSQGGTQITLDTGTHGFIQKFHFGNGSADTYVSPSTTTHPNGQSWKFDQRAEVGVLTRNIKIQGNADSDTSKFGGHVIVKRGTVAGLHGSAFLNGVELFRMGQKQVLGRYPMHWHMMLDQASGQFLSNSSVHHSFNRAITIHGTDSVSVENNVVYSTMGHAIFLEDGSEENNKINGNLVMSTLRPEPGDEMLPSDNQFDEVQNRSPASYWITNPNNEMNNNVAAGTIGTGFWFIFPEFPTGLSSTEPTISGRTPQLNPLGSFDGNVAHSCGNAFDVNDSIFFFEPENPLIPNHSIQKNRAWIPPTEETITDFTAYANHVGLYSGIGNNLVKFRDNKLSDQNENIRFAAPNTISDSIIIANTGNVVFGQGQRRGYIIYDGPGRVIECHFQGFFDSIRSVISGAGAAKLHTNHIFSGITHDQLPTLPRVSIQDWTNNVNSAGAEFGVAIRDIDGSFWGTANTTITSNHPLMFVPTQDLTPSNVATNNFARLSPYRFGHLRFTVSGPSFSPSTNTYIKRLPNGSLAGSGEYSLGFVTQGYRQYPLIVEDDFVYAIRWDDQPNATAINLVIDDVQAVDSAILRLAGLGTQANLNVSGGATQVNTLGELRTATSTSYLILGNNVWVRFAGVGGEQSLDVTW